MLISRKKPIVFAGPSLPLLSEQILNKIELRPPIKRGDLDSFFDVKNTGTILIIDGVFGSTLSISSTECREILFKGWCLIGASSMGALRASDLWSVGMIGIGDIYNLFRIGVLRSEADVAVAINPKTHEEVSVSIVHIRFILAHLEKEKHITKGQSRRLLIQARGFFWFERNWDDILSKWKESGLENPVLDEIRKLISDKAAHPKKLDAYLALTTVLSHRWKVLE